MEFDQTEFTRLELDAFAPTGYVYVPSNCRDRMTRNLSDFYKDVRI